MRMGLLTDFFIAPDGKGIPNDEAKRRLGKWVK